MWMLLLGIPLLWSLEVVGYVWWIPTPSQRPRHSRWLMKYLGTMVYGIAYVLSLLRAPLGLVPYLVKLFLFFVLRIRYEAVRTSYPRELLNLVGDLLNFGLTAVLVWWLVGPPRFQWLSLLLYLPLGAELLRLLA